MAINWKRKAKEYEIDAKYYEKEYNEYSERPSWSGTIALMLVASGFTILFLGLFGAFHTPISELDISKDSLANYHVKEYYPEFENCTVEYDSCTNRQVFEPCIDGANVFCNVLDNRDGMKVKKESSPTQVLIFEDQQLEEILLDKCGF